MNTSIHIRKQILRLILGLLAFLLPIVLPLGMWMLGADPIFYPSISSYYFTDVRFLFQTILILFGLAFILYGLSSRQRLIGVVTGILTLLIAFFPTQSSNGSSPAWMGYFHIVCPVVFFALLGWMIRYTFNLPIPFPLLTKVGTWIWVALGLLTVYFLAFKSWWPPLVYILETVILWLFTAGVYIRSQIDKKLSG